MAQETLKSARARDGQPSETGQVPTGALTRELREPLGGIARTLHRLSLKRGAGPEALETGRLLRRARALAAELQEVIDALLADDGRDSDRRSLQETMLVLAAFEDARADAGGALAGRHVTVACPEQLAMTTDGSRLRELLVCLLVEAARHSGPTGEIHVVVSCEDHELAISVAGMEADAAAGPGLDRIQTLAAELGGRIDVVAHPDANASVRVRLPQQRDRDGTVRR